MKKHKKASRKRMLSRNNRYQKSGPGVRTRITPENEQIYVGNRPMRRKEISKNRKKAVYNVAA